MPVSTTKTTLLEALNIIINSVGETRVALFDTSDPFQRPFIDLIKEVAYSTEARGWWFNQQTGGVYDPSADVVIAYGSGGSNWPNNYPEEIVQFIIVRAHRLYHQRMMLNAELLQFSQKDEEVAYALLVNAHVTSSENTVETHSNYPTELRNLGLDEFLFHRANIEEKLGMFKLPQLQAETNLINSQKLKTDVETARLEGETAFAITPEEDRYTNEATITTYQDYPEELRMLGYSEDAFYALPAHKKTEAVRDAIKLRAKGSTTFSYDAEKDTVNRILSVLGEFEVATASANALSDLVTRRLRIVDRRLQEDGYHFNKDFNVELTSIDGYIAVADDSDILNIDLNNKTTRLRRVKDVNYNFWSDRYAVPSVSVDNLISLGTGVFELRVRNGKVAELGAAAGGQIRIANLDLTGGDNEGEESKINGTWPITNIDTESNISYDIIYFDTLNYGITPPAAGDNNMSLGSELYLEHRVLFDTEDKTFDKFNGTEKGTVTYLRPFYDIPKEYREYLEKTVALEIVSQFPVNVQTDLQQIAQAYQDAKVIFIDAMSERSDASIFDNFDVARSVGVNRPY